MVGSHRRNHPSVPELGIRGVQELHGERWHFRESNAPPESGGQHASIRCAFLESQRAGQHWLRVGVAACAHESQSPVLRRWRRRGRRRRGWRRREAAAEVRRRLGRVGPRPAPERQHYAREDGEDHAGRVQGLHGHREGLHRDDSARRAALEPQDHSARPRQSDVG